MSALINQLPSASTAVDYQTAQTSAWQLIRNFKADRSVPTKSPYYNNLRKKDVEIDVENALKGINRILAQKQSSLCGPASFFFDLLRSRPDLYVKLVIELYSNGKATLGQLQLQSSTQAKNFELKYIKGIDWMLMTSIKPNYHTPKDQLAGITMPGLLKGWLAKTGYRTVEDHTNLLANKGLDHLLKAQLAYRSGHAVFLFVNADVFKKFDNKSSFALGPNHWVVLNSTIKIKKHDRTSNQLRTETEISQPVVNLIREDVKTMTEAAAEAAKMFGDIPEPVKTDDRILLNAFTWGNQHSPVIGRIAQNQDARLSYFLSQFYGYISAKR